MQYDRQITISAGASRRAVSWQPQTLLLSELYTRLATPVRGAETRDSYLAMKKPQQDDLKDVGGFVGGTLNGPRRKAGAVTGRDLLALDLDHIPAGGAEDVLRRLDGLGCGYCAYSTRKHAPEAPRLRVLFPLDRTCTADEYEPLDRRMAEYIGIGMADPSTFEASRLMYYPSVCADGEYLYRWADKPMLSADGLLATYADWHDVRQWPQVPGAAQTPVRLAAKQGDPEEKPGVVGAFCRAYDVPAAMEAFLPGVYEPVDNARDRFTFTGGSTTGGAVLYDGGKFLYSHHATDPCGGRLVNAFDLVRLHKFGGLDDEADPRMPTNRLPSYEAMQRLAAADKAVKTAIAEERREELRVAFGPGTEAAEPKDEGWEALLKTHSKTGLPLPTIDNVWLILEHDSNLKDKFALNKFAGRGEVQGPLPWDQTGERRLWGDNDNAGLYWYLEKYYQITSNGKVDGALSLHSNAHSFNDVTAYLEGLNWDEEPRLDTLFIDYLGAEDTPLIRAVTRKAFVAAVARAMRPGAKFDNMTILSGPQGIGKSTLLYKMSRGWFNDSLSTFAGKEASELLQGVWLVEIAELQAFRNSDVSRIKQFISQQADRFRAAYGRHVKEQPRRCVFFGTTNSPEYLQDRTGNRRFWPIDVGVRPRHKSVFTDLDGEIDQLWAEAVAYWKLGEPLYLSEDLEAKARAAQEEHREVSVREGLIQDFVNRRVPEDWHRWKLPQRQAFWGGGMAGGENVRLVNRERVCALEVWVEALGGDAKSMKYTEAREINDVIAAMPGWKKFEGAKKFGPYGAQKGFKKG